MTRFLLTLALVALLPAAASAQGYQYTPSYGTGGAYHNVPSGAPVFGYNYGVTHGAADRIYYAPSGSGYRVPQYVVPGYATPGYARPFYSPTPFRSALRYPGANRYYPRRVNYWSIRR